MNRPDVVDPDHFQVVVVGFGPSGAVAASLLGHHGIRSLAIDKQSAVYDKPRAIAIDHEIMRLLDNLGVAEKVLPHVAPFLVSEHFGAEGQLIRRIDTVPEPYPLSYVPTMVFTQPPVEAALRAHAQAYDSVEVALGTELVDLAHSDNGVTLTLRGDGGTVRIVTADYVIGCDGASSGIRERLGIALADLVFDEPWLVVDLLVDDTALGKLPQTAAQFCDPSRPTSFIIGPGNHRRWEIMLLDGEDPRAAQTPERVWELLARWLTPEDGTLWRAASYRFHALVAERWRVGRVFIAGDAAHQQPPFIGQGMCQGVRDVANLVWKLARVLEGSSGEALLDSYEIERSRHVRELTARIKAIGQVICERDPVAARERDARILAEGGGQPRTITRQEIVPPLATGLLTAQDDPGRGKLFPQPWVKALQGRARLDAVAGAGHRLIVEAALAARLSPAIVARAHAIGLRLIVLSGPGGRAISGADATVEELDGVLRAWFEGCSRAAAIIRPDHYVFGTAIDETDLAGLLEELGSGLATCLPAASRPQIAPALS
ncbi:bifunctional 3-(3-hydroxy-phenyl)propionate/3-hydroxycinnamic acid hydroxylase [Bosea sp. PAMC 26642]|uniref:bifunctional 3-(3-hydroxy-phenyl)propionate/3-hydroxycinnamic acid hydroxylase n=1 Tax=Bosea sp. (strain PAMC 26642) TaxID=1792307 RepID=UPI0007703E24|nr:bifunctional 3-(3-hydroxy-phenyl)propionate/3-hydroxycinnamic acid hydroxylase [Bosea sp. PAMC 26642]AMJ60390.1 FAD-binding monooxygenase [Bosea sp. PAMC 26642]